MSVLTLVPDYIKSPLRRSNCTCTERNIYSEQIAYGSGSLLKISAKEPERDQSSSSKSFVSSRTAKSHKYMV